MEIFGISTGTLGNFPTFLMLITEDWKSFTISLLPHLTFLEIHPIIAEEREKAALRYTVGPKRFE